MDGAGELRTDAGQSAQIEKLAAALVAAQGELVNPPKTKTVYAGQKKYSFAPLPEIIDAVRPVLAKHGLAVVQLVRERAMETRLIHTSGQWMGAAYALPQLADSQAMGSAISYARRYCLCAILGIAGEDDEDGEAASEAERAEAEARRKEAVKRLDALKAKGEMRSAYDGRVLAPGEGPLPAEEAGPPSPQGGLPSTPAGSDATRRRGDPPEADRKAGRQGTAGPTPTTTKGPEVAGIAKPLADLMRRDGITPEALKSYYVGKGHLPGSVEPQALPADYVAGLTKPENWKRALVSMKGGK